MSSTHLKTLRQVPLALPGDSVDPNHASKVKRRRAPAISQQGSAPADRFVRLVEVLHLTGVSRSTLYRLVGQGDFPTSVTISTNAVAWLESEVLDWIARRVQKRNHSSSAPRG